MSHEAAVTAVCRKCRAQRSANLAKLLLHLGPKGSLLDRHPPCWELGCKGRVVFYARPADGSNPRPCMTMARQMARFQHERRRNHELKLLRERR